MDSHFESIAIAGAWGYIGRKFLDAARQLNLSIYAFDPGPAPADVDLRTVTRLTDEAATPTWSSSSSPKASRPPRPRRTARRPCTPPRRPATRSSVPSYWRAEQTVSAGRRFGTTALHDAARAGHKDVIEVLLKAKANVNAHAQHSALA